MTATTAGIEAREARLRLSAWVLLAAYFLAGLLTLSGDHRWGDDWAQYVLHARNLVDAHPYADTGYLFNPHNPGVGPPTYPPGVPLLLAAVVAVFGVDIAALKVVGLACITLSVPVAFRLVSPTIGKANALAAVAILALHPAIWEQRQLIQSEAPYLLFSLLTLLWGSRPDSPGSRLAPAASGAILGLLLYSSVSCRSVGIALLPALLVHGWARRKPLGWFAGFVAVFSLLLAMQMSWLVAPTTYAGQLQVPTVGLVVDKPGRFLLAWAELFPLPLGLSQVAGIAVILATAAGALLACRGTPATGGQAGGLRGIAARVPLIVWYLATYLGGLLVASIPPEGRLLIPQLPIVLALSVQGVSSLAGRLSLSRRWSLAAGIVVGAYLLALHGSGRFLPVDGMATCPECREMFASVRQHTAPDEVIVFNKPRAMALLAGRKSWRPWDRYTADQLDQQLKRLRASVVVVGAPGSEFAKRFPAAPSLEARIREPGATVVFRNASFVVLRLADPPAGT